MFEYIFGELTVKKIDYVALDINGLAYKIFISLKTFETLGEVGQDEKLYTHTHVKEDDISFYGFKTENERELFKALISTSGVGPKLALAILSTYNVKDVINIVVESNSKLFKKLNIIETYNENGEISRGKVIISDTSNTKILLMKEDIKLALESLGYVNADVSKWIKDEELSNINDIGEAIKTILQKIQNKK